MQRRRLGRTGLDVSVLTLGCGAVGGLMVKGDPSEQERAVALALERGINVFDTAPLYGNGASEANLGRILGRLKADVILATKVRIPASERDDIAHAIRRSLAESLVRLGRRSVDILQLHNALSPDGREDTLTVEQVLDEVVPAFETLRREGAIRFTGWTAIGDVASLHRIVDAGVFDTGQMVLNLLNPSAVEAMPAALTGVDFGRLMARAHVAGMGTIGIRVLAGGALSGRMERHPNSMAVVKPIGSGVDYAADVKRATAFRRIIHEGHVGSLPELAIRYAIAAEALSTTEIGIATLAELEAAIDAVEKGALSPPALALVGAIQRGL